VKALLPAVLLFFAAHAGAAVLSHASIEKGRYLAQAGDCAACHTAEGGKPFAGGRAIPTPFGTIYSTNITPDKETGIGNWKEEQFYRAMHEGMAPGGRHLYPAFPYPWYTKLTREDVDDLLAYLSTREPVRREDREPELPWPFSVREVMAGWNRMFLKKGEFQPDPGKSAQWNRGAYLVEGLGHCGACHSAKNMAGAPKKKEHLAGGYGENWYATSLANDVRDGLGDWSVQEIAEYLKTGSNDKAAAAGPMAEVVAHSTQHLSQEDLLAIATYLKEVPAPKRKAAKVASGSASFERGRGLYFDQCIGCHMENGEGQPGVFPPLKGNAVVQSGDPGAMIHMILDGAKVVSTQSKPTGLAMPAYGGKLTDQDVADLATFLRGAWGNQASAVQASRVAKTRGAIEKASAGR
jgi:mono/diheme cytochrome c family protein